MSIDIVPVTWQLWCLAVLLLAMVMVVESDMRQHRIPNVTVLFVLLAGVAFNTFGPANGREGLFSQFPGALGASNALLGALVGLALFLPLYLLHAMGAGDVKFMAALGAFVGPLEVVGLALVILLAGGALAIIRMAQKRMFRPVFDNVFLALGSFKPGASQRFDPATRSVERIPYALAFAGGMMVYGYWRLTGGVPLIAN